MVKGITRQVILVKSPDPKLFEEAIFIVKEEALARESASIFKELSDCGIFITRISTVMRLPMWLCFIK